MARAPGSRWARQVGFTGVDVFFIISGYVMWLVSARDRGGSDADTYHKTIEWPLYQLRRRWIAQRAPRRSAPPG